MPETVERIELFPVVNEFQDFIEYAVDILSTGLPSIVYLGTRKAANDYPSGRQTMFME